jgi:hypothetical protein
MKHIIIFLLFEFFIHQFAFFLCVLSQSFSFNNTLTEIFFVYPICHLFSLIFHQSYHHTLHK